MLTKIPAEFTVSVLQVALSDHELKAGLKLAPAEREATVLDEPVSDVIFSQFRATVSGTVTCLGVLTTQS